jgi:hypothetical protein
MSPVKSVVRRPFLLDGSRLIERSAGEPLFDRLDLRLQCLNFPMLPEYDVAELGHRLLQIGYLGLYPLQGIFKIRQRFEP